MKAGTAAVSRERWMRLALGLAAQGRFAVSPNPMVGACVVKNDRLISAGFHRKFGGAHAEIEALRAAGQDARGASLYVTLEPCSSWGKTPPCVPAVIESGVKEVLIASLDPNPAHQGEGVKRLKKAGLRVVSGVLAAEAEKQNAAFFKWMKTGLPYVTLKMAQTFDGKIATRAGRSRWITSPAARKFVHELRAGQDAVLVGKNTLLADDPFLNPRMKTPHKDPAKPWRIAIDPLLQTPQNARIFQGDQQTLLAVSEKTLAQAKPGKKSRLCLIGVPEKNGKLDLKSLLKTLGSLGVSKILAEGGGETAWSLIEQGLVDKAYWIMASKIFGGRNAKTSVEGPGVKKPDQAFGCKVLDAWTLGEDWVFETEFK